MLKNKHVFLNSYLWQLKITRVLEFSFWASFPDCIKPWENTGRTDVWLIIWDYPSDIVITIKEVQHQLLAYLGPLALLPKAYNKEGSGHSCRVLCKTSCQWPWLSSEYLGLGTQQQALIPAEGPGFFVGPFGRHKWSHRESKLSGDLFQRRPVHGGFRRIWLGLWVALWGQGCGVSPVPRLPFIPTSPHCSSASTMDTQTGSL